MNSARLQAALGWAALMALCGLYLLAIRAIGPYAWDDGAITLAYARTLAENGVFALTQHSEKVEGTSSLLLSFWVAAWHRGLGLSFQGLVALSQLSALAAWGATLALIYRAMAPVLPRVAHRLWMLVLLGALPMWSSEIQNGMEMVMFAGLLTAFVMAWERQPLWNLLLIPCLLLVRFEAIFYLGFSLSLLCLLQAKTRRKTTLWGFYTLGVFLLLSGLRWLYFEDVLPNTIWAKMNYPYVYGLGFYAKFSQKLDGLQEFLSVNSFLLAGTALVLTLKTSWRDRLDLKVLLLISFGVFSAITGANIGYEGRMFLACLPLFVLIVVDALTPFAADHAWLRIDYGSRQLKAGTAAVAVTLWLGMLLGSQLVSTPLMRNNLQRTLFGAHQQGQLPGFLQNHAQKKFAPPSGQAAPWLGVTPENYKLTGLAVEAIRVRLGLKSIRFMVPDVGGAGLCCQHIQIIDSALLTNKFLAKQGYGEFDRYLAHTQPQVIETHDIWSQASGIYASGYFKAHYQPAIVDGNVLWLDAQVLERMLSGAGWQVERMSDLNRLGAYRYGGSEVDQMHMAQRAETFLWEFKSK